MRREGAGVPGGRSSPSKGPAKGVGARQVVAAAVKGKPREERGGGREGEQNGRQKKTTRGVRSAQQQEGEAALDGWMVERGFDGPNLRTTAWNSAHMGLC